MANSSFVKILISKDGMLLCLFELRTTGDLGTHPHAFSSRPLCVTFCIVPVAHYSRLRSSPCSFKHWNAASQSSQQISLSGTGLPSVIRSIVLFGGVLERVLLLDLVQSLLCREFPNRIRVAFIDITNTYNTLNPVGSIFRTQHGMFSHQCSYLFPQRESLPRIPQACANAHPPSQLPLQRRV